MGRQLKGAARWIAGWEPLLVAVAALPLLFPTLKPGLSVGALAALILVWSSRWVGFGHPGARTPLDLSLLALMLPVPLAVWASPLPAVTLPKLTGLILGVAVFRAVVNACTAPGRLALVTAIFLAVGLGLTAFGLLGTTWAGKIPGLARLVPNLDPAIQGLPGAEGGIHPNELAGMILMFFPIAVAASQARKVLDGRLGLAARMAAVLASLFFGAVLVLTQSRSAWLGAAAGLGVMVWLRWRWVGWLALGALLLLAIGIWLVEPEGIMRIALGPAGIGDLGTVVGTLSPNWRFDVWKRAADAIHDFPITGTGLGTFRHVLPLLYPLYGVSPDVDVAHAHNIYLQVALDLGLPGLVAYLALVGTALWIGWRVARNPRPGDTGSSPFRWLAFGIVGSLTAFHVYGLTDAIALGARPGVALWMLLALAAVLWNLTPAAWPATPVGSYPKVPANFSGCAGHD